MAALTALVRGVLDGRLSVNDCRLLLCVRVLEVLARAAVGCTTIPAARAILAGLRPIAAACHGCVPESRIIWAFQASERWQAGRGRCLARALAAEVLLERTVHVPRLVIGIAAPENGALRSHAWVERDGRILIGGSRSEPHYVRLVSWSGGAR